MRTAFAVFLIAVAAPAFASNPQPETAPPAPATAEGDKKVTERKICKRIQSTESRLAAKKVCMTKAQWREYEAS